MALALTLSYKEGIHDHMDYGFKKLDDWKDFERLCTDLLDAEGFLIESEPYVDRTGADIIAVEVYQSHDPKRQIRIRWRVQCKHYAGSGSNLGRKEVEESLYNYGANRGVDDGLFLIVDTDYTETAKETIDKYIHLNAGSKVTMWNQRQLATRLERHPHLLLRYGLALPKVDYLSILSSLTTFGSVRTLLISDQSAMAHNITSILRSAGFDITFLPFWTYSDPERMKLNMDTILSDEFRLIICFLGDSFVIPFPLSLVEIIQRCYEKGTALLMFPFLAWSMSRRVDLPLQDIVPVKLQNPITAPFDLTLERVAGAYRRGDFRWLLTFDSFAEDQYTELDPTDSGSPFVDGIGARFGLSHSFEYLTVNDDAKLIWADTTGNPMVVVKESGKSKSCYLNTCCHSCMTPIAISSPLEASPQFGYLLRNILKWLLK